ncbi:hypothetical protein LPJ59_001572 [Coemansia sp. RSA 2399]|nr:hypothetical protein LPJ59_001572 [Coemansia sp. RSA 2399]
MRISTRKHKQPKAAEHPSSTAPHVRSTEWTSAEKEQVFDILKHGRVPAMTIVQRLGYTKTLGQVADFLDHMEFWATALDTPSARHKRLKTTADCDIVESNASYIAYEEDAANRIITKKQLDSEMTESEQLELKEQQANYDSRVFSKEFVRLLASVTSRGTTVYVGHNAMAKLNVYMVRFLQRVIGDIVARTKIASTSASRYRSRGLKVSEAIARDSLAACGYSGADLMQSFNDLLDRHVDLSEDEESETTDCSAAEPNDLSEGESSGDSPDTAESDSDSSEPTLLSELLPLPEHTQPAEQTQLSEPAQPSEQIQSSEPAQPSEQTQLSEPAQPSEHTQSSDLKSCPQPPPFVVVYDDPVYYCDSPTSSARLPSDSESGDDDDDDL